MLLCAPGSELVGTDSRGCGGSCVMQKPCVMLRCASGFDLVGTDAQGCGGDCVEQPCLMMDCFPGFNLVGTDSRGCGGTCEDPCMAATPTCPQGIPDDSCICPAVYSPVCGCDGVMYSNSCMRACAGAEEELKDNTTPTPNPVKKRKKKGKMPKPPKGGPGPVINSI